MAELLFETSFHSYRVINTLGEGGSGRVYKVEDDGGKVFALKCLDASKTTKEKRKRFKNEIFFCLRNTHKHIITVSDYGITAIKGKECPFYVMPYYLSTLRELMKKGIAPDKALHYFSQILDGVEAAHLKSIWHRDLKPENILHDPALDLLVIADFGIAHFGEEYLQTSLETDQNTRLANFRYAAPEQRTVGQTVDQRADIYALGLILYEMFTGMLLQGTGHRPIASVAAQYAYVDNVVEGMVRQLPEDRFASIDIVKQRLIAYKNDFVSRQRLSELTSTVIPQSEIDDPLVIEPVTLLGIDDYKEGKLILRLSQSVTQEWVQVFYEAHHRQTLRGGNPSDFSFSGNSVIKIADEDSAQRIVDYFKGYLSTANEAYKNHVLRKQHQREEEERQRLQAQVEEEERSQRILKNIRI
jgi:serine/threonine protein kinase